MTDLATGTGTELSELRAAGVLLVSGPDDEAEAQVVRRRERAT